jgi:hypothetical protein
MSNDEFDIEAHQQRMSEPGKWVFIVPVSGVILTKDVNNEFRIKRVLLVSQEKLPRIRRRLGIPQRISDLKGFAAGFFDAAPTFAVLQDSGKPDELKNKCLRLVKDELSILAVSQLGYSKRRFGIHPAIQGEPTVGRMSYLLHDTEGSRKILEDRLTGKIENLILHGRWKGFHRKFFSSDS